MRKFFPANFKRSAWKAFIPLGIIYFNLLILYGYTAVLVNDSPLRPGLPELSMNGLELFNIFGVFSYYETTNLDVLLEGKTTDAKECLQPDAWIRLNPDDYLPFWRGEQHTRAWAKRHYDAGGKPMQQEAHRVMARKIKARYNRLHPDCPLATVAIGEIRWPRDPKGYTAQRTPEKLTITYWYGREKPDGH